MSKMISQGVRIGIAADDQHGAGERLIPGGFQALGTLVGGREVPIMPWLRCRGFAALWVSVSLVGFMRKRSPILASHGLG